MSVGGVFVIVATADYYNAIVLPKTEKKAVACFQVAFVCLLAVTFVCAVSVFFKNQIAELFKTPEFSSYYFLMPIYVFVTVIWQMLSFWYTRQKAFVKIARYQISNSFLNSSAKYVQGLLGVSGGLIFSSVFAPMLAVSLSVVFKFNSSLRLLFKVDTCACREVALEYQNFPKYSLPKTVVTYLNGNLPVLLLTPFVGVSEIGFFGMALTLAFRPLNMISGSLYQVFYQRTCEQVNDKLPIVHFYKKLARNSLMLLVPSFLVLFFVLPYMVVFLLGDAWEPTATIIQYMLPWLGVNVINATINYLVDVFAKQKENMWIEVARALTSLVILTLGMYLSDFYTTMLCFFVSQFLFSAGQFVWYLSLVNTYEKRLAAK